MELFTVNRYNEEQLPKSEAKNDEEKILEKLLKKAEKRKRKHKEAVETSISEQNINGTVPEIEAKPSDADAEQAEKEPQTEETEIVSATNENENDFQVLGEDGPQAKRQKVEMVLPPWLAHPTIIAGDDFTREEGASADADPAALKNQRYLKKQIRHALKQMKIKRLFPVQRAVIPWILNAHLVPPPFRPRDICVSAPTGSGKTLAFAIPIVQMLLHRVNCKVSALVVLPVAELALQVFKVFNALCSKTPLEVCLLSKQHRFEDEQEKLVEFYKGEYFSKVDIVVSTPGRLVDHMHGTKGFCLKSLRFLVIDEADRIMDSIFHNWLYHLDSQVRSTTDRLLGGSNAPPNYLELLATYKKVPHKLLFSATMSQDPEKLQSLNLFQPKLFTTVLTNVPPSLPVLPEDATKGSDPKQAEDSGQFIGKYTTPAELTEKYCLTEMRLRPLTLFNLIKEHGWKKFLCFTNSNDTALRLRFVLQNLLGEDDKVVELSATLSAAERAKRLTRFARGHIRGIVCSDALARGIDVANVDCVISYDMPRHIKTYIHRVGRTARAGKPGVAITMLSQKEHPKFEALLNEAGKSVTEELVVSPDMEVENAAAYKAALDALRSHLETIKKEKDVGTRQKKREARVKVKDTSKMTLMQKLQVNAAIKVSGLQIGEEAVQPLKKQPKKAFKQKLNPNASKSKDIEK